MYDIFRFCKRGREPRAPINSRLRQCKEPKPVWQANYHSSYSKVEVKNSGLIPAFSKGRIQQEKRLLEERKSLPFGHMTFHDVISGRRRRIFSELRAVLSTTPNFLGHGHRFFIWKGRASNMPNGIHIACMTSNSSRDKNIQWIIHIAYASLTPYADIALQR